LNAATERLKRAKDAVLAAVCRRVLICPGDAVAVEYREALAAWLDAGISDETQETEGTKGGGG